MNGLDLGLDITSLITNMRNMRVAQELDPLMGVFMASAMYIKTLHYV